MNRIEKLTWWVGFLLFLAGVGFNLPILLVALVGVTLMGGTYVLQGKRLRKERKPYLVFLQKKGLVRPERVLKQAASQMRREGGVWQSEEAAEKLFSVRTVTTPTPLWSILGVGGFDPPQGK